MAEATSPADMLRSLSAGQLLLVQAPFDFSDDEKLELLVDSVRADTGVVTITIFYMGVRMGKKSGKPQDDGSVVWTTS